MSNKFRAVEHSKNKFESFKHFLKNKNPKFSKIFKVKNASAEGLVNDRVKLNKQIARQGQGGLQVWTNFPNATKVLQGRLFLACIIITFPQL